VIWTRSIAALEESLMVDMKIPVTEPTTDVDENTVGFNLPKENLRCLVALSDVIAEALSENAGSAFWRGFIVEDRKTGEIWAKSRFRYKTGDSWFHIHLNPEQRKRPIKEQVQHLAASFEKVMRGGLAMMAGTAKSLEEALRGDNGVPKGLVTCFYPPKPEDPEATVDWLIAQDLVELKQVFMNGQEIPVDSQKGNA
jgi:hypothetical protein